MVFSGCGQPVRFVRLTSPSVYTRVSEPCAFFKRAPFESLNSFRMNALASIASYLSQKLVLEIWIEVGEIHFLDL